MPNKNNFPELFKTMANEKQLNSNNIRLTKAQEMYKKNLQQQNLEKTKKAAAIEKPGTKMVKNEDLAQINVVTATDQQLKDAAADLYALFLRGKKEEDELLAKVETMEKIKIEVAGKTIDQLQKERNELRQRYQLETKRLNSLIGKSDILKKTLDKTKVTISKNFVGSFN
jgi:hypothetical protein